MSNISDIDNNLNQIGFDFLPLSQSNTVFGPECKNISQCKPRPLLRSRADIKFSRYSTTGCDVCFYPTSHRSSCMLGSTLGSGLNLSVTPLPSYKPQFCADSPSALSSEGIALLSASQFLHNPHYCLLQERHNYICKILIERDLTEFCSMQHNAIIPEMHQGV